MSSRAASSPGDSESVIKPNAKGAYVSVLVSPRASKSEIMGVYDGALKVRLTAAPVDGAANKELIITLARFFGAPKSSISITGGKRSKRKTVCLKGMSAAKALKSIGG